jgi:hypothetical protein
MIHIDNTFYTHAIVIYPQFIPSFVVIDLAAYA